MAAWADGDNYDALNPSDANIVGHVVDKKTGEERWYWASQLGGTKEYAHATFTCGEQELNVHVTRNYETGRLEIDLTGTPENLKEHRGLHMMLMTAMMSSLVGSKENIERAGLKTED